MNNDVIIKLTKIADKLDSRGQEKLADLVDSVAKTMANKNASEIEDLIKQMEAEPFEPATDEPTNEELETFMGEEEEHE